MGQALFQLIHNLPEPQSVQDLCLVLCMMPIIPAFEGLTEALLVANEKPRAAACNVLEQASGVQCAQE